MKFEYYQDIEGNAYELKTDLEQLLVHHIFEQGEEIERLNNIINKAKEKSIFLQKRYGYVLDDLTYLLMQGSDK